MDDNLSYPAVLRIQMFGPFCAWSQQELLTWPTQKSKALFQILLIEPGRIIATDQLLEWLWPSLPPRNAQNNLWVSVSQLRRLLQPDLPARSLSAFIQKHGDGYRFNSHSDYWLDCDAFASHLAAAQSTTDLRRRTEAWEAACKLYKGDYLEDERYSEWSQLPRTQWRRRYESLLLHLAGAYGQNGRFNQAIVRCRELLTLDNANESACRLLMRCHAALGDRVTALRVYEETILALQDEIDVEPMPQTIELARQIKSSEGNKLRDIGDWAISTPQSPDLPPIVGRGAEIDQITRFLKRTAAGQGQSILIAGEPGIGKSRLVQETGTLAYGLGIHLLIAHCYQVEQTLPYQPLIDLIRQLMARDDRWKRLAPVWMRELAILLPEMAEVAAASTTASPIEEPDENRPGRLFQAIFHLFADHAKKYRLLLVVEDVQLADPATVQCIHYLARHIVRVPIALVVTMRVEALSTNADLSALLHSLEREDHIRLISLTRLTKADIITLLTQSGDSVPTSDRLGQWLHEETDGNPFFFVSLLQSLREKGLLDDAAQTDWEALVRTDPDLTLPDAIVDSVCDRLQRLSATEREALDWMAVYGRRLDFSTLQAISHMPQMTLLNTVEQLIARQLLVEKTGRYHFNHDKIREVVYHDSSDARRGLYHRQIGATLEELSPSPEMAAILAHHFERGKVNEKAVAYWMAAGEHALNTYASQQAAHHFERALALADQPAAKMDAYLGLGRSFMLLDDHSAATAVIGHGIGLAEAHGDHARRARLLYARAQNAGRQHKADGGLPEAEAALIAAEQVGDDYHLAQSLLLLTEAHESSGDLTSALAMATRAQIVSGKLGDKQLEARALVEIGFLGTQRAEFDEAGSAVERGLELLAGSDDSSALAYAWNILGRALGGRGDYSRAFDAFQRSEEQAKIIGDRYLLALIRNMRGWLHRELGDYENGLKFDEEGVNLAQRWGKPSPEISARLNVCLDLLCLGDPQKALVLLDEIKAQINVGSFGFHRWRWRLRLLHARGLCFLALDEPAKALASAGDGLPLAETNVTRKYVALNHELRGMALAQLGNMDEAIDELERAISMADVIQYQPIRWAGRRRLAKLYLQNDREQEARSAESEAEHIIQTIATSLEDEQLRATFFSVAQDR
jgi:DNA-binding SARP family transcriptional activator